MYHLIWWQELALQIHSELGLILREGESSFLHGRTNRRHSDRGGVFDRRGIQIRRYPQTKYTQDGGACIARLAIQQWNRIKQRNSGHCVRAAERSPAVRRARLIRVNKSNESPAPTPEPQVYPRSARYAAIAPVQTAFHAHIGELRH